MIYAAAAGSGFVCVLRVVCGIWASADQTKQKGKEHTQHTNVDVWRGWMSNDKMNTCVNARNETDCVWIQKKKKNTQQLGEEGIMMQWNVSGLEEEEWRVGEQRLLKVLMREVKETNSENAP